MVQILSRKSKNNPVLIGDPGVGKTAIVEGLAQRIVRSDVPEGLRDKRMTLEVTDEARQLITREVETRISRALLTDAIPDGRTIQIQLIG